jgi:hypothetical protein
MKVMKKFFLNSLALFISLGAFVNLQGMNKKELGHKRSFSSGDISQSAQNDSSQDVALSDFF